MDENLLKTQLLVPVYINEKIVLDMLAIIEDGFSMVSQVNLSEQKENGTSQNAGIGIANSIFSKLLKIDINGDLSHIKKTDESESISKEKVHTNVSLLSKFRTTLKRENLLNIISNISDVEIGSFVELEGELQKNPLIDYLDKILDVFRMANIFSTEPELGNRKTIHSQKKEEEQIAKQIKEFSNELKNSGTVDFILSDNEGTVVLSAQEQYLANDNISEILGGRFKVLGKVIAVCKDNTESIDLLRKTTLSILTEEALVEIFSGLNNEEMKQFNLPKLITKINGPSMIIIPIAIYA